MELPKGYCLFIRRLRRGGIIFRVLWIVLIALTGFSLIGPYWGWTVAAFTVGVQCMMGMRHVGERYVAASKASENPQIIYWAHPSTPHEHLSDDAMDDCKLITLHLRDGHQFEVGLPSEEMRDFIAWLKERNPSIRWGKYD
jgi:hypothetical protein